MACGPYLVLFLLLFFILGGMLWAAIAMGSW